MTSAKQPVEHVLKKTSSLARRNRGGFTVSRFAEKLGQSSLPAVLAVPAMAVVTPLSGVPLFSSACGALICLISVQMLMGRRHLWIPGWLGRRRIQADAVRKGAAALRGSVRWMDRHSGKRLALLTRQPFLTLIQTVCLICGALMPLLEIVPFSSSVLGGIVSLLAVSMLTRDGLIALITLAALFAAAAAIASGFV
ncbi:exopolysaccharide biosynthesis protein [Leisingera sp. SS27]|uniref:exopolysaccharide biosynthesis protein n=1 Tax=Leisingera sp. SS27 TaxID=2979462 RepID=UPI00232BE1ED|nr:exopolysaccharide biosynthesis protein [Leisingera sp. SS27]MDC0658513.1 exopolysaccharide biosynthesis protein [Leisingera sp. SS27]